MKTAAQWIFLSIRETCHACTSRLVIKAQSSRYISINPLSWSHNSDSTYWSIIVEISALSSFGREGNTGIPVYKGITSDNFQLLGMIPVNKDWICVLFAEWLKIFCTVWFPGMIGSISRGAGWERELKETGFKWRHEIRTQRSCILLIFKYNKQEKPNASWQM